MTAATYKPITSITPPSTNTANPSYISSILTQKSTSSTHRLIGGLKTKLAVTQQENQVGTNYSLHF